MYVYSHRGRDSVGARSMPMPWFSSRGQILQLVASVIGILVALAIKLAIPASMIGYIALFVGIAFFAFAIGWAIPSLAYQLGAKRGKRDAEAQLAKAPAEAKPNTQTSSGTSALLTHPIFDTTPRIFCMKIILRLGAVWEHTQHARTFRIVAHDIERMPNSNEYWVDIEVLQGTAGLYGGSKTKSISVSRYWIPTSTSYSYADKAVIYFDTHITENHIFILRVDHINVHDKEVNVELNYAKGKAELLTF